MGQTVAEAVAVIVPQQGGLSVHHADGALLTGGRTGTAAIAFFPVNLNDFPYHIGYLLFPWLFSLVFP